MQLLRIYVQLRIYIENVICQRFCLCFDKLLKLAFPGCNGRFQISLTCHLVTFHISYFDHFSSPNIFRSQVSFHLNWVTQYVLQITAANIKWKNFQKAHGMRQQKMPDFPSTFPYLSNIYFLLKSTSLLCMFNTNIRYPGPSTTG